MKTKIETFALSCLGLFLLLSGCSVGPNYHPPRPNVPKQWSETMTNGVTNLSATNAAWWKTFHDPELDSIIARALHSNLDLRLAGERVREARAARGVVAADYWPSVDASSSFLQEKISKNGFPTFPPTIALQANVYQTGFDAAWEVDVFGGTRRAVEAANADISAAEYGRRQTLVSLLGEVARDYVDARGYQRRLAIARQNIKSQSELLALTRERFKAGLNSDLDVQQQATLLATTEAQVPSFEFGFKDSVYRLGVLLAQPPGALLKELSTAAPIPPAPPVVPVGLPAELLQRRPDIQRAERQLAAANARIGVAMADLFPKFSLTGDVGLQSISTSDWITAGSRFWTVGPTAQWRIFDAGRIRSNIRVQNARQEEALTQYEQTVLASLEDVETALTSYAQESIRRQSLERAVQSSQQALELSDQLYRNGLADYLSVLESQRSLYQNEDLLTQSEQQVTLNVVSLYKALGGGWENQNATALK